MKTARWVVPCVIMGLLMPLAASGRDSGWPAGLAQGPLGGRITISSLPEQQKAPAVTYNAQSQEFLVVWWNDRPGNDDVYAQRTDRNGQPVGPWFAITWGEGVEQHDPDVAWNSQRNEYLVVWVRDDVIYGRRVGPLGELLGSEFVVNSATQFHSFDPAVAYASTSDSYLVVWVYQHVGGGVVQHSSIVGRQVSSDGQPQGGQVYLSQDTQGNARWAPELAYNRSRNEYLVAWQQWDIFAAHDDVRGRRVTGNGDLLLPASIGIAAGPQDQLSPSVAAIATGAGEGGRYLVTWVQAGTQNQVLAQRLDADATPQGTSILLGLADPGDYGPAAVYGNEETGTYLAAWPFTYIQPFFGREIHAREITMDGALASSEVALDGTASYAPDVAAGQGSTFLIAYYEQVQGNRDIWGQLWGHEGAAPTPTATATHTEIPPSPTGTRTPTSTATQVSETPAWTPTATATVPAGCGALLENGDFEVASLDGWWRDGDVALGTGRSSSYGVVLGGRDNAAGELGSVVELPDGANPIVWDFWWRAEAGVEQPGDILDLLVQYGDEQVDHVGTLRAEAPLNVWQRQAVDLTTYAGQPVAITYFVHTDGDVPSTFLVDDVQVRACGGSAPGHLIFVPILLKHSAGS